MTPKISYYLRYASLYVNETTGVRNRKLKKSRKRPPARLTFSTPAKPESEGARQ